MSYFAASPNTRPLGRIVDGETALAKSVTVGFAASPEIAPVGCCVDGAIVGFDISPKVALIGCSAGGLTDVRPCAIPMLFITS